MIPSILSFLDTTCFKKRVCLTEYTRIKNTCIPLSTPSLYNLYLCSCGSSPYVSIQEFYTIAKQYLYYDKHICKHGVEFIYYVDFDSTFRLKFNSIISYTITTSSVRLHDEIEVIPALSDSIPKSALHRALLKSKETKKEK